MKALRAAALLLALAAGATQAGSLSFCDRQAPMNATEQDRLIHFAGLVKDELARSGSRIALVARSGLDLQRFGQRYSHAGLSLQRSANAPWSVRQLYYACDERRPRLFDQGLPGFMLGTADPSIGYVSIVLLPDERADELERLALDNARALELLGADYSANAYAFGLRYQNCNQWLAELMASAWGGLAGPPELRRRDAQRWLAEQGYQATVFDVGLLRLLAPFIPWVHSDDHPDADLAAGLYRVSMPEAIEQFVQARFAGVRRIELCHRGDQVVIRRGGAPIAEGCAAGEQDETLRLD